MILEPELQDVRRDLLAYIGNVLPATDRDAFDRRLLEDDAFARQVDAAEFLLLEEFVEGTLTPAEHKVLKPWIDGSPQRQEQTAITAALRHRGKISVQGHAKRKSAMVWLWVVAAAACLAVVLARPMLRRNTPTSTVTAELHQQPELRQSPPVTPDTILLEARRLRGATTHNQPLSYNLHSDRPTRIEIIVPKEVARSTYSAELRADGAVTKAPPLRFEGLKTQGSPSLPYIEFTLPSDSLAPNQYTVILRSPQGDYVLSFSTAFVK